MSTGVASTRDADISGIVTVAVMIPFDKDKNFGVKAGVQPAGHLVDGGCDALILAGTTGESPVTTAEEELEFPRAVRAKMGDEVKLVAGAGINDTTESIELAKASVEAGADVLFVITPYYSKLSQKELHRYFTAVADVTEVSVCLYDTLPRSVIPIEVDTIYRSAEHPRIQVVKDAKGNLGATASIIADTDLARYSDDNVLNLSWLSTGATGFISVIGHVAPQLLARVRSRFDKGDPAGAQAAHAKMTSLSTAQAALGGVSFTKFVLRLQGIEIGDPRLLRIAANDQQLEALEEAIRKAGVL